MIDVVEALPSYRQTAGKDQVDCCLVALSLTLLCMYDKPSMGTIIFFSQSGHNQFSCSTHLVSAAGFCFVECLVGPLNCGL